MTIRLIACLLVGVQLIYADTDEVCFDRLGCFSMGSPWRSLLRPLPEPYHPEKIQPRFYLTTRKTIDDRYLITTIPEVSLQGSDYDGTRITFFIAHGFASNGNSSWVQDMKNALLKKFDANVIVVDWGVGASFINYLQVASNTRVVAAETVRVVRHLLDKKGAEPSLVHLIGHSLGAQVSSYIAKKVKGIGRLTALDPAQPGFEGFDREVRLDSTDAEFVEVIHTDARPFIPLLGFGMMAPAGHVDFYVNGGFDQPGCIIPTKTPDITSLADLALYPVEVIANLVKCPHSRAYQVFIASLTNDDCTFWGHPPSVIKIAAGAVTKGFTHKFTTPSNSDCSIDSCSPMTYFAINYPAKGTFVVPTTGKEPYCISEPKVDNKMARALQVYRQNGSTTQRSRLIPDIPKLPVPLFG